MGQEVNFQTIKEGFTEKTKLDRGCKKVKETNIQKHEKTFKRKSAGALRQQ